MSQPIWNNLKKTLDDDETIEQAIERIVASHNDDPQAHIETDQSLQSHRTNPVADHPEDSVVNDKIQPPARNYIAIVDPGDPEAFETIEQAVAYAITKDGGKILLRRGVHDISTELLLPTSCSLYGEDRATTTLRGTRDLDEYIYYDRLSGIDDDSSTIADITLENLGGGVISCEDPGSDRDFTLRFNNVRFIGGGRYVDLDIDNTEITDCKINCSSSSAFRGNGTITIIRTRILQHDTSSTVVFFTPISFFNRPEGWLISECTFDSGTASTSAWFAGLIMENAQILNNVIDRIDGIEFTLTEPKIIGNIIVLDDFTQLIFSNFGGIVEANKITGGMSDSIFMSSNTEDWVVTGNILRGIDDAGSTNSVIANNVITG